MLNIKYYSYRSSIVLGLLSWAEFRALDDPGFNFFAIVQRLSIVHLMDSWLYNLRPYWRD